MKKFIFTSNVIALLVLVPALLVGYLHENNTQQKPATGEVAKTATAKNFNWFSLVRTY